MLDLLIAGAAHYLVAPPSLGAKTLARIQSSQLPGLLEKKQSVGEGAGFPQQWGLLEGLLSWTHTGQGQEPCHLPSLLAAGGIASSGRHFLAHLRGEGAGGEEAAGSRRELRLGVGQGLLCWELSSGSHQRGGREGAAFLGPHTPAGPAGTQPASLQPPLPARGSLPCPAFPLAPLTQTCCQCWAARV